MNAHKQQVTVLIKTRCNDKCIRLGYYKFELRWVVSRVSFINANDQYTFKMNDCVWILKFFLKRKHCNCPYSKVVYCMMMVTQSTIFGLQTQNVGPINFDYMKIFRRINQLKSFVSAEMSSWLFGEKCRQAVELAGILMEASKYSDPRFVSSRALFEMANLWIEFCFTPLIKIRGG